MYIEASQLKNNKYMLELFYNKNMDMLFADRGYVFSDNDIGEKIFRNMIFDSILFFENECISSLAMRNPNEVLKDTLKNDYSAFIGYVDNTLADKDFDGYCTDSYDRAIECANEIYERVNQKKSVKTLVMSVKNNF